MVVSLVGIKHSGKSTFARKFAELCACPFVDTDAIIEETAQKTVREIYRNDGKDAFLMHELSACKKILTTHLDCCPQNMTKKQSDISLVIATGGGICDNQEAFKLLQEKTCVVFLDVDFETIWGRIEKASEVQGSFPPYINPACPKESFVPIYEKRKKVYAQIASLVCVDFSKIEESSLMLGQACLKSNCHLFDKNATKKSTVDINDLPSLKKAIESFSSTF